MSNLNQQLWACADVLRSRMDASEYKNYLLGLVFYKYLSDQELRQIVESAGESLADFPTHAEQYELLNSVWSADPDDVEYALRRELGYFIKPDNLFYRLTQRAKNYEWQLSDLQQAFTELSREGTRDQFAGLFDDIDLNSTKLGSNPQQRNVTITEVMKALDEIDLLGHEGDVIGDAYEYLIGEFAAGAGKKAGEFYTPQPVSRIISQIVALGQENLVPFHIYDPALGSGSLMLHIRDALKHGDRVQYHGQELNTTTYNLARMNLILHGVEADEMRLRNGDTLDEDWPTDEPHQFDGVVMNPPYSAKWSAAEKFLADPRYERFGRLAPKSKADYAFLLHGFYHLKDSGTMGIVLPHGVLFRGAAEGVIRQKLLEMGAIDAVIGLPANIFYGTSIPTVIIILKKSRTTNDVLFIDASQGFEKVKNRNLLRDQDIDKIVTTYIARKDVDKYAHVASFDEIKANDFNLNIPRYVDTSEEEPEIDIVALSEEMAETDEKIVALESEILDMLDQLVVTNDTFAIIEAAKRIISSRKVSK